MTARDSRDGTRTSPVEPEELRRLHASRARSGRVLGLLIVHEHGVEARALDADGVVVGREAPADLRVADATLSREHARFSRVAEGEVRVQDLGSTNGVWLGKDRITDARLRIGAQVMLGGVLVRVHEFEAEPQPGPDQPLDDDDIIAGPAMRALLDTARQVADSRIPVIVRGETGVGKELMARFIHDHSTRRDAPIVSLNCGAIPSELVESTLFGHERGAFTGAQQRKRGVFESADGGTVFLDEIGELPHAAQVALLRVLETGRITRVGGVDEHAVDVRVIAATHRDLDAMIETGDFRADLYYRLDAITLEIPPLRVRADEIAALAARFLRAANAANRRSVRGVAPDALALLSRYDWPGNVRELRNVIERAVVITRGADVAVPDLPARIRALDGAPPPADGARTVDGAGAADGAGADPPETGPRAATQPVTATSRSLRDRLQEYEAQLILDALHKTRWNRSEAAQLLDMPLRTLAHKIKALGLDKAEG